MLDAWWAARLKLVINGIRKQKPSIISVLVAVRMVVMRAASNDYES